VFYEEGIADRDLDRDPTEAFRRSVEEGERSLQLGPHNASVMANLAVTLVEWADWQLAHGGDPSAHLDRADTLLAASLPKNAAPETHFNLGLAHRVRASWLIHNDRNPSSELALGQRAAEHAVKLGPNIPSLRSLLGDLHLTAAQWDEARHRSPLEAYARAATVYRDLRRGDAKNQSFTASLAKVLLADAEWQAHHARNPASLIAELTALLDGAGLPPPRLAPLRARLEALRPKSAQR